MIATRLRRLSKDLPTFNETKGEYEQVLLSNGYKTKLVYEGEKTTEKKRRRNRRKRCIYFNPPYCMSVKTNIGRSFLNLVEKHFDSNHPFHQIFSKATIKVSYSCMANVKSAINAHNRKVLNKEVEGEKVEKRNCNCRKEPCPVNQNCLTNGIIYQAKVTTTGTAVGREERFYIGSSGRRFKDRFNEHTADIANDKRAGTTLSKYIWELKRKKTEYNIEWKILKHASGNGQSKICTLCSLEKWHISMADKKTLLNKRSELTSKCPHFKGMYFRAPPRVNFRPGKYKRPTWDHTVKGVG